MGTSQRPFWKKGDRPKPIGWKRFLFKRKSLPAGDAVVANSERAMVSWLHGRCATRKVSHCFDTSCDLVLWPEQIKASVELSPEWRRHIEVGMMLSLVNFQTSWQTSQPEFDFPCHRGGLRRLGYLSATTRVSNFLNVPHHRDVCDNLWKHFHAGRHSTYLQFEGLLEALTFLSMLFFGSNCSLLACIVQLSRFPSCLPYALRIGQPPHSSETCA